MDEIKSTAKHASYMHVPAFGCKVRLSLSQHRHIDYYRRPMNTESGRNCCRDLQTSIGRQLEIQDARSECPVSQI